MDYLQITSLAALLVGLVIVAAMVGHYGARVGTVEKDIVRSDGHHKKAISELGAEMRKKFSEMENVRRSDNGTLHARIDDLAKTSASTAADAANIKAQIGNIDSKLDRVIERSGDKPKP